MGYRKKRKEDVETGISELRDELAEISDETRERLYNFIGKFNSICSEFPEPEVVDWLRHDPKWITCKKAAEILDTGYLSLVCMIETGEVEVYKRTSVSPDPPHTRVYMRIRDPGSIWYAEDPDEFERGEFNHQLEDLNVAFEEQSYCERGKILQLALDSCRAR